MRHHTVHIDEPVCPYCGEVITTEQLSLQQSWAASSTGKIHRTRFHAACLGAARACEQLGITPQLAKPSRSFGGRP